MARTFHRHRHGDENVQSKCQQFLKKIKWRYSKKKKRNELKVWKFTQI